MSNHDDNIVILDEVVKCRIEPSRVAVARPLGLVVVLADYSWLKTLQSTQTGHEDCDANPSTYDVYTKNAEHIDLQWLLGQ